MVATHLVMRAHSQKIFTVNEKTEENLEVIVDCIGNWAKDEWAGMDGAIARVIKQMVFERWTFVTTNVDVESISHSYFQKTGCWNKSQTAPGEEEADNSQTRGDQWGWWQQEGEGCMRTSSPPPVSSAIQKKIFFKFLHV